MHQVLSELRCPTGLRHSAEKFYFATRALLLQQMAQPEIMVDVLRIIVVNAYIRITQSVSTYISHMQTVRRQSALVIMQQ